MGSAALTERIGILAAQIHAAHAELAALVGELDESGDWCGDGIRDCAHWLTINTGLGRGTACELVRVAQALHELPMIASAFHAGELSLDKVRAVTRVAVPTDEEMWLGVARAACGAQLTRICNAFHRVTETDDERRPERQFAARRLEQWWSDDGMLHLVADLPPEDGELIRSALDRVMGRVRPNDDGPLDPANEPVAARRADALVSIARDWLATEPTSASHPARVVVHVDAEMLTGDGGMRCHLDNGPAVAREVVRRLGCDGELVRVIERDGSPIDAGRARRVVSTRLRRALAARDAVCRFPGCGVPAGSAHAHHIEHWADGGETSLQNLVTLCSFHHHRLHDAAFRISRGAAGELIFERPDGRPVVPIRPQPPPPWQRDTPSPEAPRAGDGGAHFSFGYAIGTLVDGSSHARAAPVA